MGIDQWEWEGMGILIVLPHTSTSVAHISNSTSGNHGALGTFSSPSEAGMRSPLFSLDSRLQL